MVEKGYEQKRVTATYDMAQDAMGLGDFITQQITGIPDDASPVVYVETPDGAQCVKAEWIEHTLTDGSITHELILHFE